MALTTEEKTQPIQQLSKSRHGPVEAKSDQSRAQFVAAVFWDGHGIQLDDLLKDKRKQRQKVTSAYYETILRK